MKVGDKDIEGKIFEVTRELIYKFGVRGWNMDDLSEACSMSKRTLYKIISNKEELLLKISLASVDENIAKINEYFNSNESYEYLLDNFGNALLAIFNEYIIKNSDALRKEYPRIGEAIQDRRKRFNQLYTDFFKKGKELGYFVDFAEPEAMCGILNDILGNYVLTCKDKAEFEEKMGFAIQILVRGIRK